MSTKKGYVDGYVLDGYEGDGDVLVTVTGETLEHAPRRVKLLAVRSKDGLTGTVHPSNLRSMPRCPHCRSRRTLKPLCGWCQQRVDKAARRVAKIAKTPGTAANLGSVTALLETIAAPDGWTRTRTVERWHGCPDRQALVLAGDGISIKIVAGELDNEWAVADGHTSFTTCKGERTFDRTGVEDSFYVKPTDTAAQVAATIAEQVQRVAESRERLARSETVPGLPGGWSLTPERKAEIAATLAAGRSHSFTPAGFGTGYNVYALIGAGRRPRFDAVRLPAETAAFFGVPGPLYYTTLDCD